MITVYSSSGTRYFFRVTAVIKLDFQNKPAAVRNMATLSTAGDQGRKLFGRAFYKSIGSPKVIIAPMVDQSEFVSFTPLSRTLEGAYT